METQEICRDIDFLINLQKFIEDLIGLILKSKSNFMIWIDQHRIKIGNPDYFWDCWGLIFNISFSENKQSFQQHKNFVALRGKTHIGKYFFFPIWIEVFEKSEQISIVQIRKTGLCGKMTKISRLTPKILSDLLKNFAKNPPETKRECFEYHIPEKYEEDPRLYKAMKTVGLNLASGVRREAPTWTVGAGK